MTTIRDSLPKRSVWTWRKKAGNGKKKLWETTQWPNEECGVEGEKLDDGERQPQKTILGATPRPKDEYEVEGGKMDDWTKRLWEKVGEAAQWAKAEGGKLEDGTKQASNTVWETSLRKHHQCGTP